MPYLPKALYFVDMKTANMTKWLFLTVLLSITQGIFAQDVIYRDTDSEIKNRKAIKDLKDGTLIVRLLSERNAISFLREKGLNKKADERQAEIDEINKIIIESIRKWYDFSEVRFVYGSDINDEFLEAPANIFLTDDLEIDTSITLNTSEFFVLSFSGKAGAFTKVQILDNKLEIVRFFPGSRVKTPLVNTKSALAKSYKKAFSHLNFRLRLYHDTKINIGGSIDRNTERGLGRDTMETEVKN